MSSSSKRVVIGLSQRISVSSAYQCRHKSTTSAIRAGLRAEQGTRGRARRAGGFRSSEEQRDFRADKPTYDRPLRSSRTRVDDNGSPRTYDRPNFKLDSASAYSRDRSAYDRTARSSRPRIGGDQLPRDTGRSDSRNSAASAFGRDRAARTQRSSYGRAEAESPRSPRSNADDTYQAEQAGDEAPMNRKERRAKFWEENKPHDDDDEELEPLFERPSRSPERPRRQFDVADRSQSPRRAPRQNIDDGIPEPIHYTTASSKFIYGANTVLAALLAQRRKIYKLYMHKRAEADNIAQIRRAATAIGVEITRTGGTDMLDRLSEGRPHNGVVLECSTIPAPPVLALEPSRDNLGLFKLKVAPQTAEEQEVNGSKHGIRFEPSKPPLVLFLDGVTDPGNIGNIIRTAHFFGVDAVAIAAQTCAPIDSAVLAKASAGACEAVPILSIPHASAFVLSSKKNGWLICAAVSPADIAEAPRKTMTTTTHEIVQQSTLARRPRILMLGAEGEGLRDNLKNKADVLVTIPSAAPKGSVDIGVDSLNVATAAALLIDAFKSGTRQTISGSPDRKLQHEVVDAQRQNGRINKDGIVEQARSALSDFSAAPDSHEGSVDSDDATHDAAQDTPPAADVPSDATESLQKPEQQQS